LAARTLCALLFGDTTPVIVHQSIIDIMHHCKKWILATIRINCFHVTHTPAKSLAIVECVLHNLFRISLIKLWLLVSAWDILEAFSLTSAVRIV
jgi:hypothetical protein